MGYLETLALQGVSTETISIIKDYYIQNGYLSLIAFLGIGVLIFIFCFNYFKRG
jgi:hypothetical protein